MWTGWGHGPRASKKLKNQRKEAGTTPEKGGGDYTRERRRGLGVAKRHRNRGSWSSPAPIFTRVWHWSFPWVHWKSGSSLDHEQLRKVAGNTWRECDKHPWLRSRIPTVSRLDRTKSAASATKKPTSGFPVILVRTVNGSKLWTKIQSKKYRKVRITLGINSWLGNK